MASMTNRNNNCENNYDTDSGLCYACKTPCTNKCSRCDEWYCSLKCQRDDWSNHRYVCFKMPYLKMGPPLPNEYTNNNTKPNNPRLHNGFHKTNEKFTDVNRSLGGNLSSTSSTSSLAMRNQSEPEKNLFGDLPKNNEDVVLTWVSEINSYYIRTYDSLSEHLKNTKDFHQHGLNANKLQHVPKKNDIVLVRWDQHFVRALVLNSSNNENIHVALLDIGGTTHKPLSHMREISDELSERKRSNFKIGLDIGRIGEKEYQKLLSFVREKIVFKLQFDGDTFAPGINVKLFEKGSGFALDKLIRSPSTYDAVQVTTKSEASQQPTKNLETKEHSKLTSLSQQATKHTTSVQFSQPKESLKLTASVEPQKHLEKEERQEPSEVIPNPKLTTKTFITDLTSETLQENVADILVLDTSTITVGCISVIELKNVEKLNRLQARIKDIIKDLSEEYDPEDNEVCLAKFAEDQEWYRAEYIGECKQFCFIDYGNYSSVNRKDVRKLPLSLRDPCYTVPCHIDNFATLSSEGIGKLTELLLQNQIQKRCIVKRVRGEEDEEEVHLTLQTI